MSETTNLASLAVVSERLNQMAESLRSVDDVGALGISAGALVVENARDEIDRLRTLLSTLMEAVEPFAKMDDEGIEDLADNTPIEVWIGKRAWFHLKVSDLRALTGAYLKAKGV